MRATKDLIRHVIQDFCCDFVQNPYLCYTEHGQHALFYTKLLAAMPEDTRYASWRGQRVCTVQKEYPTAHSLGKSRRQHWDIALLKRPLTPKIDASPGYDFLHLEAVVEFGMNEAMDHLQDDIARISHPESNVESGFIVHLVRLSDGRDPFSKRDDSPKSKKIVTLQALTEIAKENPVEIWYAVADLTDAHTRGVWLIQPQGVAKRII